jgi:hypothetical protein
MDDLRLAGRPNPELNKISLPQKVMLAVVVIGGVVLVGLLLYLQVVVTDH